MAAKAMESGPERDAAFKVHLREWGEYLTARRRAHPQPVPEERVSTGLERARSMLACIKDRSKWPSANSYDSYIAPLEPVNFQDGCLLVRSRGQFPAEHFNRNLAYKALSLLSGYQVTTIQAIYDAPMRVELDEEELPAEEEAPPAPTYAALPTYATVGEYTNAMMGALIGAWGYEGQTLDDTTRGTLARVGAQLRQSRIHPAYVPLFVSWVRRQHRLARPGQMQGLVPDFVKTYRGETYDNYPPLEQLDWLPQVIKKPEVEKRAKGHKGNHAD